MFRTQKLLYDLPCLHNTRLFGSRLPRSDVGLVEFVCGAKNAGSRRSFSYRVCVLYDAKGTISS